MIVDVAKRQTPRQAKDQLTMRSHAEQPAPKRRTEKKHPREARHIRQLCGQKHMRAGEPSGSNAKGRSRNRTGNSPQRLTAKGKTTSRRSQQWSIQRKARLDNPMDAEHIKNPRGAPTGDVQQAPGKEKRVKNGIREQGSAIQNLHVAQQDSTTKRGKPEKLARKKVCPLLRQIHSTTLTAKHLGTCLQIPAWVKSSSHEETTMNTITHITPTQEAKKLPAAKSMKLRQRRSVKARSNQIGTMKNETLEHPRSPPPEKGDVKMYASHPKYRR